MENNNVMSKSFVSSSIGKKMIVALTGFFLVVFIIIHLGGNTLLYAGPDVFNAYTYNLTKNKGLLYAMEVVLLIGFLTHIIMTIQVTWRNRGARIVNYKVKKKLGMSTIFSSNMALTGTYIFIFLVIHLRTFKYGAGHRMIDVVGVSGAQVVDMYAVVTESFKSPYYSLFYILAMFLIGGHLSHGLQSAFRSLGFYETKLKNLLQTTAVILGVVVGLGFASIPFYFGFLV